MTTVDPISPYELAEPPTSPGRALLARAFAHWCALHHGFSGEEIAAALDGGREVEESVRRRIVDATRLLGEVLAAGRMRSWARPLGGGRPVPLDADLWELDDFRPRLARSALSLDRPFDAAAPVDHYIFVELEDFNGLVEASCADVRPPSRARAAPARVEGGDDASDAPEPTAVAAALLDRHLRLPEVKRLTGFSRTTIYARMAEGRFPATVPTKGNIASWRESDVAAWLADPR